MEPLVCVNCLFLNQSDGPFAEYGHMVQKSPCLMENDAFFLFKVPLRRLPFSNTSCF